MENTTDIAVSTGPCKNRIVEEGFNLWWDFNYHQSRCRQLSLTVTTQGAIYLDGETEIETSRDIAFSARQLLISHFKKIIKLKNRLGGNQHSSFRSRYWIESFSNSTFPFSIQPWNCSFWKIISKQSQEILDSHFLTQSHICAVELFSGIFGKRDFYWRLNSMMACRVVGDNI